MANNEKWEELGYRKSLPEEQSKSPRRGSKKVSKTGKRKAPRKLSEPQQSTLWNMGDIGTEKTEKASEELLEATEQDSGQLSQQSSSSNLIRLTGLWESSSGALIGNINQTSKLLIFKNDRKSRASEPDYIAYMSPAGSRAEHQDEQGESSGGAFSPDDIPF